MIIVGLTGSFGTGKTFVASVLKGLGARVIDADALARKALARKKPSYMKVISVFGKGILSGKRDDIDRRKLAAIVFNDKEKRARLNRIVHPEVINKIRESLARAGRNDVVIIDAPLLIEADLVGLVDKLVVVKSSETKQVERCVKKFGITKRDVSRRIRSQIPLAKKIRMADFVVDNNGTKSDTRREVLKIWKEMVYGDS